MLEVFDADPEDQRRLLGDINKALVDTVVVFHSVKQSEERHADFLVKWNILRVLNYPVVFADLHPGIDPADVMHVFLHDVEGDRVFACTILPDEGEPVAALEAWVKRDYPEIPVPRFQIEMWSDA